MTNFINYYEVLQVVPFADDFVIKAAYRVLASHFHPDKNQVNSGYNMQLINDAYATLINTIKRVAYDGFLQSEVKKNSSHSDQMSNEFSAGKIVGKMILKELLKKTG